MSASARQGGHNQRMYMGLKRFVGLAHKLLPAICSIAEDVVFVFHQDSAPEHRARDTVELTPVHQS